MWNRDLEMLRAWFNISDSLTLQVRIIFVFFVFLAHVSVLYYFRFDKIPSFPFPFPLTSGQLFPYP